MVVSDGHPVIAHGTVWSDGLGGVVFLEEGHHLGAKFGTVTLPCFQFAFYCLQLRM